ncbi:MAG: type 1 glutamine amidotransferase domain-containing protein [Gammaproteobacteria bacterium]
MTVRKAVLIVVTSHDRIDDAHKTGLWFEEFSVPYRLFRAQGYQIAVASPKGGPTPLDPHNVPEDIDSADTRAALQALDNTVPLADVHAAQFDAIFFPGGHGTMYDLPGNPHVISMLGQFAEQGKIIAAVCHGPAALIGALSGDGTPLVKGRNVTMFTNEEEQAVELADLMPFMLESRLRELGAHTVAGGLWQDHTIVDGKLVTGQNPQSSSSVAQSVIKLLGAS